MRQTWVLRFNMIKACAVVELVSYSIVDIRLNHQIRRQNRTYNLSACIIIGSLPLG